MKNDELIKIDWVNVGEVALVIVVASVLIGLFYVGLL